MCLVFKTTYIDRRIPLREGAFSFTRMPLFPPLDKRNTRDKAKGLCISSERHIGVRWACDGLAHEIEDWTRSDRLHGFIFHPYTAPASVPYSGKLNLGIKNERGMGI